MHGHNVTSPGRSQMEAQALALRAQALETSFALTEKTAALPFSDADLLVALDRVKTRLAQDGALFEKHREVFTRPHDCIKAGQTGDLMAAAFTEWRAEGGPSIPALLLIGAELLGIPSDHRTLKAALLIGLMGETGHSNPYHDRNHFREVVAMAIRLCMVHKQIEPPNCITEAPCKDRSVSLGVNLLAQILLAAPGHDILHDGSEGNIVNGVYIPYRLEQMAIDALEPVMEVAGMAEGEKENIRLMIRTTDVTVVDGQKSPRQYLCEAVAYHQGGGQGEKPSDFPPELAGLLESPHATLMASILSDSDMGPSVLTYEFCQAQSRRLSFEKPVVSDAPGCILYFTTKQLRAFISPAGLRTCAQSLEKVVKTAEHALKTFVQNISPVNKP